MSARLPSIVSSNKVIVFSWVRCPFCVKAKQLLGGLVPASEMTTFDLDSMGAEGEALHNEVIAATQHDTVPAIYIKEKFIGGFSDLDSLQKSGELEKLLQ